MNFTGDDVKSIVEVVGPLFAGVWYLRGALVKIQDTLEHLGEAHREVKTTLIGVTANLEDHSRRLRAVEMTLYKGNL